MKVFVIWKEEEKKEKKERELVLNPLSGRCTFWRIDEGRWHLEGNPWRHDFGGSILNEWMNQTIKRKREERGPFEWRCLVWVDWKWRRWGLEPGDLVEEEGRANDAECHLLPCFFFLFFFSWFIRKFVIS